MVRAIEIPLMNAGYLTKLTTDEKSKVSNPGLRIKGKLSFRGKQKAAEYYEALKEAPTDPFGFAQFRAMASVSESYGIVHAPQMLRWYVSKHNKLLCLYVIVHNLMTPLHAPNISYRLHYIF